jgi:hypothetical protein
MKVSEIIDEDIPDKRKNITVEKKINHLGGSLPSCQNARDCFIAVSSRYSEKIKANDNDQRGEFVVIIGK